MKQQMRREENVWSLPGNWDRRRQWRWNFCAGSVVTGSGDGGADLLCYLCSMLRHSVFFCLCSFAPIPISLFGFSLHFLLCYLLFFLFSPLCFLPLCFFSFFFLPPRFSFSSFIRPEKVTGLIIAVRHAP